MKTLTLLTLAVGLVPQLNAATLEVRVAGGLDDAEEHLTAFDGTINRIDFTSSDLELGAEGGGDDLQEIGIRFRDISVPAGSIINSATIQFTVDEADDEATSVLIFGELSANALEFSGAVGDITSRDRTTASVAWNNIPIWDTEGMAGPDQLTPDLSNFVQEIVGHPGWSAGNAMAFIFAADPGGERTAESFDGSAPDAPLLLIDYTVVPLEDTDGDGMPDAYEDENGLDKTVDDTGLDADNDGSTNGEEFKNRTDPQDTDTDDDGLLDGVESNTGIWVSVSDTGTDPFRADSDDDDLKDGVENPDLAFIDANQPGTDPNKRDTDGDRFDDGEEVARNFDPTDGNSFPPEVHIEVRVAGGLDDAEEHLTDFDGAINRIDFTSSDLELGAEGGGDDLQEIGIRFRDISVPAGSIINSATIQFTVDEVDDEPTSVLILGELAANALEFNSAVGDITSRARTTASVEWNDIPIWDTEGVAGPDQLTPDLSNIVQEIVGQTGWSAGNAMAFIFAANPDGERTAESFDGSAPNAPLLLIDYTVVAPVPFQITVLNYNSAANTVNVTWKSKEGSIYTVAASPDLQTWTELTDGYPSGGGETTYADDSIPAGTLEYYYYVREED